MIPGNLNIKKSRHHFIRRLEAAPWIVCSIKQIIMKEPENCVETFLSEVTNISVDINPKETFSDDIDHPIIDIESGLVIEYPKLWDFILTFNSSYIVESDNPKYLEQKAIHDYGKFVGEKKLNAFIEIDDFVVSENSMLKKRNYLSSFKLQFEELLHNYYCLSEDKFSEYFNLLGNDIIIRSISENKKINNYFEKKLVHSFLIIQRNTIQTLIRYIDEMLHILSNTENDTSGELKKPEKMTSDSITQIGLSPTLSHEIFTKSFLWYRKESFKRDILLLFELLTRSDIIPKETDFNTFCYAFSWEPLLGPLRIKWLVTGKNKQTSKSSLFYFISILEDHKLIESKEWSRNNMPLYQKISIIFSDKDNNMFTIAGLKSSYCQGRNSTCTRESEIDKIVEQVASLDAAKS